MENLLTALALIPCIASAAVKEGFKPLTNGKDRAWTAGLSESRSFPNRFQGIAGCTGGQKTFVSDLLEMSAAENSCVWPSKKTTIDFKLWR